MALVYASYLANTKHESNGGPVSNDFGVAIFITFQIEASKKHNDILLKSLEFCASRADTEFTTTGA